MQKRKKNANKVLLLCFVVTFHTINNIARTFFLVNTKSLLPPSQKIVRSILRRAAGLTARCSKKLFSE